MNKDFQTTRTLRKLDEMCNTVMTDVLGRKKFLMANYYCTDDYNSGGNSVGREVNRDLIGFKYFSKLADRLGYLQECIILTMIV